MHAPRPTEKTGSTNTMVAECSSDCVQSHCADIVTDWMTSVDRAKLSKTGEMSSARTCVVFKRPIVIIVPRQNKLSIKTNLQIAKNDYSLVITDE
jgi:hypothetical protein